MIFGETKRHTCAEVRRVWGAWCVLLSLIKRRVKNFNTVHRIKASTKHSVKRGKGGGGIKLSK